MVEGPRRCGSGLGDLVFSMRHTLLCELKMMLVILMGGALANLAATRVQKSEPVLWASPYMG